MERCVCAGLFLLASCGGGGSAAADPAEVALLVFDPGNTVGGVARNRAVRLVFSTTVLPESVNDQTVSIRTGGTLRTRPPGSFVVVANTVTFDPTVTETGGANAAGFPAGAQVIVRVPIKAPLDGRPAAAFVRNLEGNPIVAASGPNVFSFTTGTHWDDPRPGSPSVVDVEFAPAPRDEGGPVAPRAFLTLVFDEPIDPATVQLGENLFLTNVTESDEALFGRDIPARTFFDASLTRISLQPVFGFGRGPFTVQVGFLDPAAPGTFDQGRLPRDLGALPLVNFLFRATFETEEDPAAGTSSMIRENFLTGTREDAAATDAVWGTDPQFPGALVSAPIVRRTVSVDLRRIVGLGGGVTTINQPATSPPSPPTEEDYCPTANPLVGPDLPFQAVPTSSGRRQQNLYRRAELGGPGTVVRVAWGPDSDAVFATTYRELTLRLGHKQANTSLSAGNFFSQFDVDGFVTAVDRRDYAVPQAADVNGGLPNDGYLDWPALEVFFEYDGQSDLLLDVEAREGTTFQTFRTFLAVSGTCDCTVPRGCVSNGSIGLRQADSTFGNSVHNPPAGPNNPAPFVNVMQFEFANLLTRGTSLFYDAGVDDPDYVDPVLTPQVQEGGATVAMFWSGSSDGIAVDVPFTPDIDEIDGFRHIRFRADLRANLFTGARARLRLVEIPLFLR